MTVIGERTGLEHMMAFGSDVIPRERFTSVAFLELEYERLWGRVWQIACRLEEIPNPGDFIEYTIGDRSALVIRSSATELHAFANTCPHRGTRLGDGCGTFQGEIRCRFHGWRWDLEGNNTFILDDHEFPPLTDEETALAPLTVDTWGGFVFVHFGADPEPLLEFLAPIPALMDPYRPERMRYTGLKRTIMPANWKVVIDAFNEGYHLSATHPELLQWKDDAALEYEVYETHTRYGGAGEPKPSPRLGIDPSEVDQTELLARKIQDLIDNLPGYFGPDDLAALGEVMHTPLPDGVTAGDFYLNRRRTGAVARGLDWSHLSDEQVLGGDDVLMFPSVLGPAVGGGWFLYRCRPNGMDPNSSIFEVWTLDERAPGAPETPVPELQDYPDPKAHDWGLIVNQDVANFEAIQTGLRVPGRGLHWNLRQEMGVRRFHEVLDRYLFDAPT
ncbi:MAG: (2Fe-2S)-binding protein [Actinomycetia bacterium]|nr:(2Fe-2S)-binding protein [Actinomycetes bacterium]